MHFGPERLLRLPISEAGEKMEYIQDQNQKISIKRVGEDPVLGVHQKGGVYWLSFPQLDARLADVCASCVRATPGLTIVGQIV